MLAAYLVYILWRSRAHRVEGFLEGDVSGSYYIPIRDSTFTAGGNYKYDDEPNEVMFYEAPRNLVYRTDLSLLPSSMRIATLDELRRETGYGMNVCNAGFVNNDGVYISVYPNTSELGKRWCGGTAYDICVSNRGDCSGGLIMVFEKNPSNGIYVYGVRPTKTSALATLTLGNYTLTLKEFNTVTGQWSRYDTDLRLKQLESFVVYPVDPTEKFDASGSDTQMLDICQAYDSSGTLATIQQIKADQAAGANWKRPGWLARDNPRKEVYPISDDARAGTQCMLGSGADEECKAQVYETKTVNITTGSSLKSGGIVCYGKKPAYENAEKLFGGKVYRAEFFNTYTARWSKYSKPAYKCAASDLTTSTADPERNYLRRAAKYVKAMQTAGAHITLGKDSNAEYPGCGAGSAGDDASGCWACSPIPGTDARAATAPTEPKSQSGNWKSIGETIDPTASLTDVAMDVSTVGGKAKLKRGIELILACQRASGVPTVGANTNYPGCGTGWCCAPDNQFTLGVGTIGGPEVAGECEPVEPPCIPSELVPTQPAGAGFKRQCRPKLAQSIKDTKVNRAAHVAAANADKLKASVMRDVAQQLKADKLYSLCQHA